MSMLDTILTVVSLTLALLTLVLIIPNIFSKRKVKEQEEHVICNKVSCKKIANVSGYKYHYINVKKR